MPDRITARPRFAFLLTLFVCLAMIGGAALFFTAGAADAPTAEEAKDAPAEDEGGAKWVGRSAERPPLPRFVSLRSAEVNVRTGPGTRYPVAAIYNRKDLPVEVTAEYENWRKIRDVEGAEGWAHMSLLSGRRTAIIQGEVRTLYNRPAADAVPLLRAEPGVVGRLMACERNWCEMDISNTRAWIRRDEIWGVYPDEDFH
ncbi:SH3 domain-containing protein [Tistrella mobilis]|uniref:SH3 domain-containing protein n=1 Tax=Tistrella mobilis TaxID=171437 RepID=UPI003557F2E0